MALNLSEAEVRAFLVEKDPQLATIAGGYHLRRTWDFPGYWPQRLTLEQVLRPHFPLNAPLLDIGCGPGWWFYHLSQRGYTNLAGSDRSPQHIQTAAALTDHLGVKVALEVCNLFPKGRQWQAITAFGFLYERTVGLSPGAFLEQAISALSPGGVLCFDWYARETPHRENRTYTTTEELLASLPAQMEVFLDPVTLSNPQFEMSTYALRRTGATR